MKMKGDGEKERNGIEKGTFLETSMDTQGLRRAVERDWAWCLVVLPPLLALRERDFSLARFERKLWEQFWLRLLGTRSMKYSAFHSLERRRWFRTFHFQSIFVFSWPFSFPHSPFSSLQLNASDDRGIDVVREQIKSFASTKNVFRLVQRKSVFQSHALFFGPLDFLTWTYQPSSSDIFNWMGFNSNPGGFKLIVLDEADAMTQAAQGALRRGEFGCFLLIFDPLLPLFSRSSAPKDLVHSYFASLDFTLIYFLLNQSYSLFFLSLPPLLLSLPLFKT